MEKRKQTKNTFLFKFSFLVLILTTFPGANFTVQDRHIGPKVRGILKYKHADNYLRIIYQLNFMKINICGINISGGIQGSKKIRQCPINLRISPMMIHKLPLLWITIGG